MKTKTAVNLHPLGASFHTVPIPAGASMLLLENYPANTKLKVSFLQPVGPLELPVEKAPTKSTLTPEGRERLRAAMRKRWAEQKKKQRAKKPTVKKVSSGQTGA